MAIETSPRHLNRAELEACLAEVSASPREQGVPAHQTAGPKPKRVRHQAARRLRQLLPLVYLIIATLGLNSG